MSRRRWVMIDGRYPGIGKSTLAKSLCDDLIARGIPVDHIPEEAIFDRPEFAGAAAEFRQKKWPSEGAEILDGYQALARKNASSQAWIVFDWGCAPMAEDLPWAIHVGALIEHVYEVRMVAVDYEPIVVFLDGDLETALKRAFAERGQPWLERYAGLARVGEPGESLWERAARHLKEDQAGVDRNLLAYEVAGWRVERLDAVNLPGEVLSKTLSVLNLR